PSIALHTRFQKETPGTYAILTLLAGGLTCPPADPLSSRAVRALGVMAVGLAAGVLALGASAGDVTGRDPAGGVPGVGLTPPRRSGRRSTSARCAWSAPRGWGPSSRSPSEGTSSNCSARATCARPSPASPSSPRRPRARRRDSSSEEPG